MDNNPGQNELAKKEAQRRARADRRNAEALPLALVGDGIEEHYQHEELWFEDGNVIVVARKVWFKLHRGILAKHSSVFRDMFQVADSCAGDSVQGCPTVNVTDSPQQLTLFFMLLYDAAKQPFFTDPRCPMDFRDIRGLTLLSFKYDVQHIQTEAVRRLKVCYPATLEEWDGRYPHSRSTKRDSPRKKHTLRTLPIDCIAAINLARRFNLDELLPAAFYICAMQSPEDIIAQVCYGDAGAEDMEELSRVDLTSCLRGLGFIQTSPRLQSPKQFDYWRVAVGTCTERDRKACSSSWTAICGSVQDDQSWEANDILRNMYPWLGKQREVHPLCDACWVTITVVYKDMHKRYWRKWKSEIGLECESPNLLRVK